MEGIEEAVTIDEEVKEPKEAEKSGVTETIVEDITDTNEPIDVPVADVQPVVIEENGEKADEKPVEKMETDSTENAETVPVEKGKEDIKVENKDNVTKDAGPVAEETPPTLEIEEVTNDKALEEVAEIIDDIEPVVEEPAATEDMEVLQSVGEVLEKECDEILSKVQDVTNLDTIPVKPLLNTITEETMETENIDSNDIVDRILDTEIELEMKESEKLEPELKEEAKKPSTVEKEVIIEEVNKKESENVPEEKLPEKSEEANNEVNDKESDEKKSDSCKTEPKEESKTEESGKNESEKSEISASSAVEQKPPENNPESDTKVPIESKVSAVADEVKPETESTESQVNGKTTNGESQSLSLNGDASKNEELSSRLSAENGKKEEVNGSNGDSVEAAKPQDEKNVEAEISDIKVKSVPTEEPHTDPKEQPTEA